jgi:hypothetical protein
MQKMNLSINNFKGHIPPSFGRLSDLVELYLGTYNTYTHTYTYTHTHTNTHTHSHIHTHTHTYTHTHIDHNYLAGSIPTSLGQLGNLALFTAAHNQIAGHIDVATFAPMEKLVTLNLSHNMLDGRCYSL